MRAPLPRISEHLQRVIEETTKAGGYLAAARSFRFVSRLEARWPDAPRQLGFAFLRQGVHMAFTVTLAAVLEQSGGNQRVNLPSLLRRFDDGSVRMELARSRDLTSADLYAQATALQQRFDRRVVPLLPALKNIRDNVVAHHGITTDGPGATIGLLNNIFFRTAVLVDAISTLMTGEASTIRLTMETVRFQTAGIFDVGIDGDADLDIGPPRDKDYPG